jgi:hypothetical protein
VGRRHASASEKGGRRPSRLRGLRKKKRAKGGKKAGWAERIKGEERSGLGFFFLNSFQILFQTLQTSLKQ